MVYPDFKKSERLISALSYIPITPLNFIISVYSLTTRKNRYPRFHAIQSILLNLSVSFFFLILFLGLMMVYYPTVENKWQGKSIDWFLEWNSLAFHLNQFSGVFTILSVVITAMVMIPIYFAYEGREIRIICITDWALKHC